ncbi:MAG: T9SS type A sorting domain-containing protein, partial [Bacteroidia bacterium]|nr:T9SS type A sorting domain-containing protein [Bacteroidia bacterium]
GSQTPSNVAEAILVVEKGFTIWVYPNPTSESVQINYLTDEAGEMTYTIYDAIGKWIGTATTQVQSGSGFIPIDMTNLTAGNYNIQVQFRDKTQTFKLLKIK